MLPDAGTVAFEHQFLDDAVLQLVLLEAQIGLGHVVDVHGHVVFEILIGGGAVEVDAVHGVFQLQSGVEHGTAITAVDGGGHGAYLARSDIEHAIGEGVLADPLVVGNEIEREAAGGIPHEAQLASGLVRLVGAVAGGLVPEKAVLPAVEARHGEGEPVADLVIMCHLGIAVHAGAEAEPDVGALILEGVLGIDAHQSALGVHAVEGALGTAQDVDALDAVEMAVEKALVEQGNSIDVHAHGRTVLAGTDATHIHGRRVARAIVGHGERGNILRQFAKVAHAERAEVAGREHIAAEGLLAHTERLFGL